MLASVYIKDGNIHFYNEKGALSGIGGIAYELGRPLLDFVCYEPERFEEGFGAIAAAFGDEFAHVGAKDPAFIDALKESMTELQKNEIYVYFYGQALYDFIYAFIESPRSAVEQLAKLMPGAAEKLAWVMDFEWPASSLQAIEVAVHADKGKHLYRAVMDVVALMSEHLRAFQKFIAHEIEVLLHYRREIKVPGNRSIDYIDILDEYHSIQGYPNYYLEKPFRTFYGHTDAQKIEQLYEIDSIEDLFRFEFTKMIEHDIFIKKCKNCERFFIPRRRADAEYCDRIYGDGPRRCSEIGATLRYERKVAENPILEAYSKAYKRFHSRTRAKKMTQGEFLRWSEEARERRDRCVAGEIPFEEFSAWLEQGRIRKSRSAGK